MGANKEDGFSTPWEIYKLNSQYYVLAKGGAIDGYGSQMMFVPELKLGWIVLAN